MLARSCICYHWAKRDMTEVVSHLWLCLLDPSDFQHSSNISWANDGMHRPVRGRSTVVEQTLHLDSCEDHSQVEGSYLNLFTILSRLPFAPVPGPGTNR